MEQIKDGGPAFPRLTSTETANDVGDVMHFGATGMSLRDYFAAKAMQGLIASNDEEAGDRLTEIPEYAYLIADAMLAAREGKHA